MPTSPEQMRKVHDEHVAAETRRDVDAAVATYHEQCFYSNGPLGLRFEGKAGVALQYAASFAAFPDGVWTIEGEAFGDDVMASWGTFRSDDAQAFLGLEPERTKVEFPLLSVVTFRDGLMSSETLYYDLAGVCDQLGISVEEARETARKLQEQMQGAPA